MLQDPLVTYLRKKAVLSSKEISRVEIPFLEVIDRFLIR